MMTTLYKVGRLAGQEGGRRKASFHAHQGNGLALEKSPMRVVALEEHFTAPALVRRIDPAAISRRGFRPRTVPAKGENLLELLPEIGERRLQSMDEAGITVQVLSSTGPGPDLAPGPDGIAIAQEMNDHLA